MSITSSRLSTRRYAETPITAAIRDGSGNLAHADPSDAHTWPRPWPDNRPRHRAGLGGGAPSRTRFALPGATPFAESRLDCRVLGDVREQQKGKVLPTHARGKEATGSTGVALGASSAGYQPFPETDSGEARMNWR